MPPVYGQVLDAFTRCSHYHTDLDIVAIRFKCCNKYFPCYQCHDELRNHHTQRWTTSELEKDEPVILCGSCQQQLTFSQYIGGGSRCVYCDARFNPKCALHYDLYFDLCGPIGAAVEDCKEAVEESNWAANKWPRCRCGCGCGCWGESPCVWYFWAGDGLNQWQGQGWTIYESVMAKVRQFLCESKFKRLVDIWSVFIVCSQSVLYISRSRWPSNLCLAGNRFSIIKRHLLQLLLRWVLRVIWSFGLFGVP